MDCRTTAPLFPIDFQKINDNPVTKTRFFKLAGCLAILFFFAQQAHAQIASADRKKLHAKEDSLSLWSREMILDSMQADRMRADSNFTRGLVRALLIKNSFYYPFDSVLGISKLYAPDTSFRIFTWNLQYDDYYSRQRGAIQMRTADGSLKLFPLRDVSEFTANPQDSVRGPRNWIGAVYYNIIKTQYNGRNYYTLFGLDANSVETTKKWMEVMYFDNRQQPVFGGPFFTYDQDSIRQKPKFRYEMEYKKNAIVLMNFMPEEKLILVDHLISETNQPELPSTFVPDGDSEGYKWVNGRWVHIDKVFTFKLKDGEAPVGEPILDSRGNQNEEKLKQKSEDNNRKNDD